MATRLKSELKSTIAENKLTKDLMNDMVDSLGQLDADENGNYAFGSDSLPSDVYASGRVILFGNNTFLISHADGSSYICKNIYLTSAGDLKTIGSGTVNFSLTYQLNIGDTAYIEYVGSELSGTVVSIASYENKRVDKLGNIAFNGARLPPLSNLDSSFKQYFYSTYIQVIKQNYSYTTYNLYKTPTGWAHYSSGQGTVTDEGETFLDIYQVPYGVQDFDVPSLTTKVYSQSRASGNINIKTGGTYTATL